MSKPYDVTLKQLVDQYSGDWLRLLGTVVGLGPNIVADPLDPDLSTISVQSDKVFRIRSPGSELLHLEAQASWDGGLLDRVLLYNVHLYYRYGGQVHSVILLLRREADSPLITGTFVRPGVGRVIHTFNYDVIRVWQEPLARFLNGGLGTLPLALLTDEAANQVPMVLQEMDRQLRQATLPQHTADMMWSAGYLLLGLRFDPGQITDWFKGVQGMEESTTYQLILKKGEGIGEVTGELSGYRKSVLAMLRKKFGSVPSDLELRIRGVNDPARLEAALLSIPDLVAITDFQL